MRNLLSLLTILMFCGIIGACSNNGNPMTPSNPDQLPGNIPSGETVSPANPQETAVDTRGIFGAWQVHIDPVSMTAEILPSRNAKAIGLIVDADLSQFLTVSPCADCLQISRISIDDYNKLQMDVHLKHPFTNAAARPDLHGFDVRAIFIIDQFDQMTDSDIKVMRPSGTEEDAAIQYAGASLLNADGYTSHYDELVTDSRYFIGGTDVPGNLNPFLRFFEDYSDGAFDPAAPAGWNVMPTGSSVYTRTAYFNYEVLERSLNFYIVADVAYGQSAVFANRMNPQYYLPAFSRTEPWRVEYWIENNNLSYMDSNSTADVVVQVFDWQHNATVDPSFPNPSNLSGMPVSSQVTQVELSIPGLQDAPIIAPPPEAGDGSVGNPLRYRLQVKNEKLAGSNQIGLLAVRDQLYGQTGRAPIPTSPAGFPYETLDIKDYACYQWIEVNMRFSFTLFLTNHNIRSELQVPFVDLLADVGMSGSRTVLHPNFFMDRSHSRFQYDWDYDYDGVTFDTDGAGLPSPELTFAHGGYNNVGLRVQTNSVPPQEYIYELPVWAEGTNYQQTAASMGNTENCTERSTKHAVDASSDHFYFAYTHEAGGLVDVYLTIVDRDGTSTTRNVSNSAADSFSPAILVIDGGANSGVYVAYSEYDGTDTFLYSNYGGLDGSGFLPINKERITTAPSGSPMEWFPVLIYWGASLHCYYERYAIFAAWVYGAHSDDMGGAWMDDGAIVNNTSAGQRFPTAVTSYSDVYLVWEDFLNFPTDSVDLWMAKSSEGILFPTIGNISTTRGNFREESSAMSFNSNQLSIAYLGSTEGDTKKIVNLKIIDLNRNSISDIPILSYSGGNVTHTAPAIVGIGDGEYNLAYASYNFDTDLLTHTVMELETDEHGPGLFGYRSILYEEVGTVPDAAANTFPGITASFPLTGVADCFTVWGQFKSGYLQSPTIGWNYLGQVDYMEFVSEKNILIF
jgi:hypothetical protein